MVLQHEFSYTSPRMFQSKLLLTKVTTALEREPSVGSSFLLLQDLPAAAGAALATCSIAALCFLGSLRFGFVFDDHPQIVGNRQVQSWVYFVRLLSTELWSQKGAGHAGLYYRPVFSVWLLLNHTIGDLAPWFWHLSSILLHASATWLAFKVSLTLLKNREAAAFTSLVFAIHPIHIESVCWISASNEPLYSLFFLASIFLFTRFLGDPHRPIALWSSVLLWGAALFTKETAVALMPVFPMWTYLKDCSAARPQRKILRALRVCLPFFVTALGYLGIRSMILHRLGAEVGRHTWRQVLFTAIDVFRFYVLKLLFPVHLSPFYSNPVLSAQTAKTWLTILVALIGSGLACWFAIRREPILGLALSLMILPLAPVLVGVRIFSDGTLTHDRYLYLPSVGLCLLAGLLFKRLRTGPKSSRWVAGGAGAILAIVLLALNISQQSYYRDDESFYKRGLEVGPANTLVMGFLGELYLNQGKNDLALQQFRHAYEVAPDDPEVIYHLASGLFQTGNYAEAEPFLYQLSQDARLPFYRRALIALSLARTQIRLGKLSSAESSLRLVMVLNENLQGVHQTLGALYEMQGRLSDAKREYERELQVLGDPELERRALELSNVP
jgi:Tfp pilus assembly protein PilF